MTDPRTDIAGGRRIAALWTGLLLAPLAFLTSLELAYLLVDGACLRRNVLPIHLVQAACLLLALAGGVTAWRSRHADGARARFMAGLGAVMSALFVLAIGAQAIPAFFLGPCR